MTLEVLLIANGEVYLSEVRARRIKAAKFKPHPDQAKFANYAGVRYSILPGRVGRTEAVFFAIPTPKWEQYHEYEHYEDVFSFIRTLLPPVSRKSFEVHEAGSIRAEAPRKIKKHGF